jgi:hypothetical protein
VDVDLDTLGTALYVRADDPLKACPQRAPWRPPVGVAPELSVAEALTLAVPQVPAGPVSPPARPGRVQQAAAQAGRHHAVADPRAGPRHQPAGR